MSHHLIVRLLSTLVGALWLLLILIGLETDRPMSGGIPGHVDPYAGRASLRETPWQRCGTIGAWALFTAITSLLPFILWWMASRHGG